jgi:hypothetical protein
MKAETRDVQFLRPRRDFQRLKDANALPDVPGADPAGRAGEVDLFHTFMSEAADHLLRVN